jgi:hypothetical protein
MKISSEHSNRKKLSQGGGKVPAVVAETAWLAARVRVRVLL